MRDTNTILKVNLRGNAEGMHKALIQSLSDLTKDLKDKKLKASTLNDKLLLAKSAKEIARFNSALLLMTFEIEDVLKELK